MKKRLTIKAPSGLIHLTDDSKNGLNQAFKKLAKYETAEEEGRLVVLPCKVGDILFCFSRGEIYPFKVRCIRIYEERAEIELWYAGDEENLKFWHITIWNRTSDISSSSLEKKPRKH